MIKKLISLFLLLHFTSAFANENLIFVVITKIISPTQEIEWEQSHTYKQKTGIKIPYKLRTHNLEILMDLIAFHKEDNTYLLVIDNKVQGKHDNRMDKKNPSVVNIVKKDLHNIIMELDKPIQFYPLGVNKIQGRGSSLIVEIYLKAQEPNENP